MRTQRRRRKESKTDYKLRLKLLKSGKERIVIRKTNKYIIIQSIKSIESKDSVVMGVTSKELLNHGWDKKFEGSLKSLPAAYLTGLLFAKMAGKNHYIVDLGMVRTIAGNRIFAAVKGLIDGGIKINANEEVFPSEDRLNGEHLKDEVKTVIQKVKTNLSGAVLEKKATSEKKTKKVKEKK